MKMVKCTGRIKEAVKRHLWEIIIVVISVFVVGIILFFEQSMKDDAFQEQTYEEINMVLPSYGYVPEDMNMVVEEMNKVSIKECGVKVNYIFTNVMDMENACDLQLDAGEEIDLMPCMEGDLLCKYIRQGTIAPLNELLEKEGEDILDIYPKEWWLPLQSNGEIYAVSAYGSNVKEEGLLIRGDVLEALNLDKEEIVGDFECKKNITIQEVATVLNPVLEKVAESDVVLENGMAVKDMKLVQGANGYGGIFSQCQLIEYEGFGNTLGCVVNQSGEVVNLYETTEYRDMLKLAKEWQQAGYIYNTDEQLTENPIMTYEMGRSLGLFSDTTQGMEERLTYFTGYPTESISLKEKVLTSEAQQLGNWVIPQSSEKKEAAMKILNLMYTSEEYVNLYFYGLEGVHYTRDEKGCVCRISGRYIQNLTWMFGNTFLAWQEEGEAPRVPDDLEDIVYSPYYGFVYDGQKYEDEIYEMEKILDAYLPELEKGNYDDISVLDEMNQRLYAAGLKEVMEDKEAQLKEWIVSQ